MFRVSGAHDCKPIVDTRVSDADRITSNRKELVIPKPSKHSRCFRTRISVTKRRIANTLSRLVSAKMKRFKGTPRISFYYSTGYSFGASALREPGTRVYLLKKYRSFVLPAPYASLINLCAERRARFVGSVVSTTCRDFRGSQFVGENRCKVFKGFRNGDRSRSTIASKGKERTRETDARWSNAFYYSRVKTGARTASRDSTSVNPPRSCSYMFRIASVVSSEKIYIDKYLPERSFPKRFALASNRRDRSIFRSLRDGLRRV